MTVDDIVYDPDTHTSRAPDGRFVPHVTAILKAVGVATDFDDLACLSPRVEQNIGRARDRGLAVHADCHAYDDGDLIVESVHPIVRPYVEAWAECRVALGLEPEEREHRLFHPLFFYTGIMDGIFLRNGRDLALVDIKTGDPDDAACHLQTAAYELAWRAMTGLTLPMARLGIQLMPRLRKPYRVTDYSIRTNGIYDVSKWCACLTVYNEQVGRRKPL